jgi:hypothetical protein
MTINPNKFAALKDKRKWNDIQRDKGYWNGFQQFKKTANQNVREVK